MAKTRSKSVKDKPAENPDPAPARPVKKRRVGRKANEAANSPVAEIPKDTTSKELKEDPAETLVETALEVIPPQVASIPVAPNPMDEDEDQVPDQTDEPRTSDLYLDTVRTVLLSIFILRLLTIFKINRAILDFDFEKVCSVSSSNINIYGCLVCGKYFQGRGRKSYAYAHSIHDDHHVFINLESSMVIGFLYYTRCSES